MADEGTFGGGLGFSGINPDQGPDMNPSGVVNQSAMGGNAPPPQPDLQPSPAVQQSRAADAGAPTPSFGAGLRGVFGPDYKIDPQQSALDQSASMIDQRMQRAASVASNPIVQLLNPEGAQKAREFVQSAPQALMKIQEQKATVQANKQQAETLGLHPGEGGTTDYSTTEQRVAVAQQRALKGDLGVFRGLQSVDPKSAEAIQDKVYETVAGHLGNATSAFGTLSNMTTPQEYDAAVGMLRKNGTLGELESMGLKVPSFDEFQAQKPAMGRTLREAQQGVNTIKTKLEERNTYQPMAKDEAATYSGRLTTAAGDKIENGSWSRNAASGTRGFIVNGMDDPRNLGKSFTLATPDQRKAIGEDWDRAVPKAQLEKYREAQRTYSLATTDPKTGQPLGEGKINTNPNVQQGIAEGMASALRGGAGGANVGLLKIEGSKRGVVQGVLDQVVAAKAGVVNNLSGKDVQPYLTNLTQEQQRYVLDYLHTYDMDHVGASGQRIAERAGALGLGPEALGLNEKEAGGLGDAFERGRVAQVERMMPHHQAIGGGDGVLQLGAQRPGAGAGMLPGGTDNTTQLPGGQPLATPVQQARGSQGPMSPQGPTPAGSPAAAVPGTAPTQGPGNPGGPTDASAMRVAPSFSGNIAGQNVNVSLPGGASPDYVSKMQRIESGNEKDPWKAGTSMSSASGAFQFIKGTWDQNKPAGAPARAKDATPQQQAEALATLTAKNAASLTGAKLPVNDTSLYIAHNLGAGGAQKLLTADPNADARNVVGEAAARNNPMFFKGRPTVAQALERYEKSVNAPNDDVQQRSTGGGAGASFWDKLTGRAPGEIVSLGGDSIQGDKVATAKERAASPVVEHAPAIASTIGAVAGGAAGPVGGVAGGAAGGAAGQSFKDWMQGNEQDPQAILKEGAIGGVLGVASEARPILSAGARVLGVGGVEAGDAALKGKDAGEVVEAGAGGAAAAAGGEAFGRALGMVGHKLWSKFNGNVQSQLREAATDLAAARETMEKSTPKLQTGGPNPAYQDAEVVAMKAERALKDAGLNPDEAAYAATQEAAKAPRAEAVANRPAAIEKAEVSRGYDELRDEVANKGVGTPKPSPKLPDGPMAAVENGKVAKTASNQRRAEEAEQLVTAPAKTWGDKWDQLVEARSKLLAAERVAEGSTSADKDVIAGDRRKLADTVRAQQKKVAAFVFGTPEKGKAAIDRLEVLDKRFANLMHSTGEGDVMNIAKLGGAKGRDADKAFKAFAHDDPQALAAWDHLRRAAGTHSGEGWLHAAIHLPFVGKAISAGRMALLLHRWNVVRAAGGNVKFSDLVRNLPDDKGIERTLQSVGGRAAAM